VNQTGRVVRDFRAKSIRRNAPWLIYHGGGM